MHFEYSPNGRQTGPADWFRRYSDPRFVRDWTQWLTQIDEVFGWERFTALHLAELGIFSNITTSAPDIESAMLRAVTGVPIDGKMIVATEHPREYRLFHAAKRRPSAAFDVWVQARGGEFVSWPTIWAARDKLLPDYFTDEMTPSQFRSAFRSWAQVDECRCGYTDLHLIDNPTYTGYFDIEIRNCRQPDRLDSYFVSLIELDFPIGNAFTAAQAVAAKIDTSMLANRGIAGSAVSVGRTLARHADRIPPGGEEPFLVRLGKSNNARSASFAVTAWNLRERQAGS